MIAAQVRDKDYMKGRDKSGAGKYQQLYTAWVSRRGADKPASITVNTCGITRRFMTPTLPKPVVTQNWLQKITDAQVKRPGVTSVNGKEEIMKYAPEAAYGITSSGAR